MITLPPRLRDGDLLSCSILESFQMIEQITGKKQKYSCVDQNRMGDHICYYSDLRKLSAHFRHWRITKSLPTILEEIAESWMARLALRGDPS
jgi:CDP-paratose 2-epimerase